MLPPTFFIAPLQLCLRRREPRPRGPRLPGSECLCPLYRNLRVYNLAYHFHIANHQCIRKKKVIRRKHSTLSSFKSSFGLASGLEGTWCDLRFWLMNGEVSFPVMPTYEAKHLSPHGGRHKDIYLHSRRNSTVAGV